jgi:U6 snRNA-associated Sm-like protein LSm4
MLVELKNGETLNGHLVQCDTYMNLTLKEVVQTSPDGDKFFRLPECYVRGNNVSLLCGLRLFKRDIVIVIVYTKLYKTR